MESQHHLLDLRDPRRSVGARERRSRHVASGLQPREKIEALARARHRALGSEGCGACGPRGHGVSLGTTQTRPQLLALASRRRASEKPIATSTRRSAASERLAQASGLKNRAVQDKVVPAGLALDTLRRAGFFAARIASSLRLLGFSGASEPLMPQRGKRIQTTSGHWRLQSPVARARRTSASAGQNENLRRHGGTTLPTRPCN